MTNLEQVDLQKFYNDLQIDVIRDLYNLSIEAEIPNEAFAGWASDRNEVYAKTFRMIVDKLIEDEDPVMALSEQNIAQHIKDEMLKLYPELNHSNPH